MRRFPILLLLSAVSALLIRPLPAAGQQDNPVYVDDSPRAWELFLLARDQAADNVGEAVRLYQELLDDYGEKRSCPVTRCCWSVIGSRKPPRPGVCWSEVCSVSWLTRGRSPSPALMRC